MELLGNLILAFIVAQVVGAPSDGEKPGQQTIIRSTVTSFVWSNGAAWSGSPIVFPGPIVKRSIAPCPGGQKLCDEDENYPTSIIQRIPTETLQKFDNFFHNDSLTTEPVTLSTKIDPVTENDLCDSKEMLTFPKKAESTNSGMKYIIQIPGLKMQGVRIELCNNEGAACIYNDTFPLGYKTICRQKYIRRTFLTLDSGSENVETSEFKIPSCCVCKVIAPRFR